MMNKITTTKEIVVGKEIDNRKSEKNYRSKKGNLKRKYQHW